jgi:hypothetical protein
MSLDPSARESNIRDSIKRHFVDNIAVAEGIELTFDKALSTPNLQGKAVNRWVSVSMGDIAISDMSSVVIEVFCCTRQDSEGFRLAQLRDTVMGYLTDTSVTDGMKRIVFYRSKPLVADWEIIGGILVQDITESRQIEANDDTKFKILTCVLRLASKI